MHRADLAPIEEVEAIIEWLDACLLDVDDYTNLGAEPLQRVGKVLGGLAGNRANKTERFINKFIDKVTQAFAALNRPITWESFYNNDFLPLRNLDEEVKEVAVSASDAPGYAGLDAGRNQRHACAPLAQCDGDIATTSQCIFIGKR